MRRIALLLLVAALIHVLPTRAAEEEKPSGGQEPDWSAFLIRDPVIQRALQLNDQQKAALDALTEEVDRVIWPWHDLPEDELGKKLRPLGKKLESGTAKFLDQSQRMRLLQMTIQSQGLRALLRPELVEPFDLTDDQQQKIRTIVDTSRAIVQKAAALAKEQLNPDLLKKTAMQCQTQERDQIAAVLTDQQKTKWLRLVGTPFNLTAVNPQATRAPEIREAKIWINSPSADPLTLAKLRGHVVAVTFWTFGCGNCQHNYPAYKAWQQTLVPKGLTLIGIHTPETQGEHKVDSVRAKARENGLNFPILIDNDRKNWDAWANRVWPAVYLIDKYGRVRYWWYGELNWKGAGGQQYMARRITELLAEKPLTSTSAPSG